jgi:hypothetical protein
MGKFSGKDRLELALYGPALLGVWWYFVPDYSTFSETPLGQLTFSDIAWHVGYLLLLIPWVHLTISLLYTAHLTTPLLAPDHCRAVIQAFIGAVSKVRKTKRLSQDSGAMD